MSASTPRPFFCEHARLDALREAARAWLGTPFHANSEDPGPRGGVCCHLLVWQLYRECGLQLERPPFGPPGHGRFSRQSLMTPWLDASPAFLRVPTEEPQPGDLLGYQMGGAVHHLAVLLTDGQIVHCTQGVGVHLAPRLDATWQSRHVATWRPVVA